MISPPVRRRSSLLLVLAAFGAACTGGEAPPVTDEGQGALPTPAVTASDDAGQARVRAELAAMVDGLYAEPVPSGQTVEVELVAAESTIVLADSGATTVWAYNGTVPGPQINVPLGDTVQVTLRNDLASPTSIHWHGIRVPNDMDGVPGLNQSAIAPGETFTYSFTPPDPGTYWYHSHTLGSEQLDRGLYGAIIVTDPADASLFDVDAVWMIDDWLLDEGGQVVEEFFDNHVAMHHGRYGELLTASGDPDPILSVQPGARVRLRLVNASNGRWYDLGFEGLAARIMAVDGQRAGRSVALDAVTLAPGNRLDVVFEAPETPGTHRLVDTMFGSQTPIATVVVEGEPVGGELPSVPRNASVPDWAAADGLAADVELSFDVGVDEDLFGRYRINGRSYPDVEPVHLTQGRFTKIRLVNKTGLLHPIHLHGQFFRVLTRGGVAVDEPFFRDTILVDSEEVIEIGIVPTDVGQWLLHCHIQEHADAGMATVAIVRPAGTPLPELRDLRVGHVEAPLTGAEGDTDGDAETLA